MILNMSHPSAFTTSSGIVVRESSTRSADILAGLINSRDRTKTFTVSRIGNSCTSSNSFFSFAEGDTASGLLKIERTSTTSFTLSFSLDGITYWNWKTETLANVAMRYGLIKGGDSSATTYTYLAVNGLDSGCSSTQVCRFGTISSSCETDPSNSFVECSANTWRTMILAPQLSTPVLSLVLLTQQIEIRAKFDTVPGSNDQYFYAYKLVIGDGEIIARIDTLTGSNSIAGVMFQMVMVSETPIQNNGMVACIVPKSGSISLVQRTPSRTFTTVASQGTSSTPMWIKLRKSSNSYTCSFSTIGTSSWTDISTSTTNSLGTRLYVGIISTDQSSPAGVNRFSNILLSGFTGYCNDRAGAQCGVSSTSLDLDQCVCPSSYVGNLCQNVACFGVIASSPSACSSRGTCVGPNNCTCPISFAGDSCQYDTCFGIASNLPNVCSGQGSCIGLNNCQCFAGFGGSSCNQTICYGKLSSNSTVCSGKGTCSSFNNCTCQAGYFGTECQSYQCFGFDSTNPSVCSGKGTCVSPNNCNCNSNFFGSTCSVTTCSGVQSNSTSVCSGNGNCTNFNTCTCSTGYTSSTCSVPICYGVLGNNSAVCSGKGSCSSPNNCTCQTGYGSADCSASVCFGLLSTNPLVCSGRGTCSSPNNCTCQTGYGSSNCSFPICYNILSTDSSVCSGRGTCSSPNTCVCQTGYGSANCSVPICSGILATSPTVCSSRGVCSSPDNCQCSAGYNGTTCQNSLCFGVSSDQPSVCSGNGTCTAPNTCSCKTNYFGSNCNVTTCSGILSNSSSVCSSRGTCFSPNTCVCNAGFTGPNCQFFLCNGISSNLPTVCSSRGSCVGVNTCNCQSGWTGSDCQTFTCQDRGFCTGNGTCVGPNSCNCNNGWTGSNCSVPICFGINATMSTVCTGNGRCTNPDICVCNGDGITGIRCDVSNCLGVNSCSGNGLCIGVNNCTCFDGWKGTNCSIPTCDLRNNCSYPNGNCISGNTCGCTSSWSGLNCSLPVCFTKSSSDPTVCSSKGTCTSPDNCICNGNYSGNNCQFIQCYGKNSSNPSNTCSGKGTCTSPDNCVCNTGYTGSECQFTICSGVPSSSPSICSGNGNCTLPNVCNCTSSYTGNNCQFPICNGVPSTNPTVCSSVGTCTAPDTCSCNTGYTGSFCQFPICYGVNSSLSTVCSSQGNCTLPDNCVCNHGFYGNNCSNSILWELVNDLCNTSQGCTLDLNTWRTCTLTTGASCFCNPGSSIQTSNNQIQCQNGRITSIKITNSGLTGSIRNIQILTSLTSIDLSSNNIQVTQTLNNVLPSQIQTINLSNNSFVNQGTLYEITKSFFPNLTSFVLDRNSICGVYPTTWINNTFGLSLNSHSKSLWCSTLNSNVCSLVSLPSFYVIYPSETQIFLSFSNVGQSCEFYFQSSNLLCNSLNGTSLIRSTSTYNSGTKNIICQRSNLVSTVSQQLLLSWNFGTFFETITSTVSVSNLPFASITGIDKRVVFTSGSGTDTITIDVNQNMTRYRKNPTNPVKCLIQPDNYAVNAISIDSTGTKLSCAVNLTFTPSQTPRTVTIVDDTNTFTLSSNNIQFYLVDTKISPNSIAQNNAQTLTLTMANNQQIPAFPGLQYYLINSTRRANCSVSGGFITTCALPSVSLTNDIEIISFNLMEENRVITSIPLLFYRSINLNVLYPKGILADSSPNVITGQMTNTIFNKQLGVGGAYSVLRVIDSTSIPLTVLNSSSFTFTDSSSSQVSRNYVVYFKLSGFDDAPLSVGGNQVHFITTRSIMRESNTVIIPGVSNFDFSTTSTIPSALSDSLSCRFEGSNQDYPLLYVSSTYFTCSGLSSTNQQNISFWFSDRFPSVRNFKISSAPILLTFLVSSPITYNVNSEQIGYENTNYNPIVQLTSLNISSDFNSRILCYQDGTPKTTTSPSSNTFTCQNVLSTQGLASLQLRAQIPNVFKIANILSYFNNELKLGLRNNDGTTMNTGSQIRVTVNTISAVSQGLLKPDCSDITVVTSLSVEIPSLLSGCNTANTLIFFNLVQNINSGVTDNRYSILYGNPFKSQTLTYTTTAQRTPQITQVVTSESIVVLSSNSLNFAVMKRLAISSSDPTSMITNRGFNLTLATDHNPPNYQGLVQYQMRFSTFNISSTFLNGIFTGFVNVPSQLTASIDIWAVFGSQTILLSTNPFSFIFNAPMTLNYLLPFAGKYTTNTITQSIQIVTQTNFTINSNLFCRQTLKGVTTFIPATTNINSNLLTCTITTSSLSLNTELIDVNIQANVSTRDTSLNYDLSSSALTFVVFKEPISSLFPSFVGPSNFGTFYNLSFTNPLTTGKRLSYQNYNVTITPSILPNPTQILSCNYGSSISCSISSITFSYVPIQLQLTLTMFSSFSNQNFAVDMGSIWFIEPLSFSTEFPFVLDFTPTPRTITFTTSKSLHQSFNYYCRIFNSNVTVTKLAPDNRFSCTFNPRGTEELANFTLVLNTTAFNLPTISDVSSVQLTSLAFDLPYTVAANADSFTIRRNTTSYKVPSKYWSYLYRVVSTSPSNTMNCNVSNADFVCNKTSLAMTGDMQGVSFTLQSTQPNTAGFSDFSIIQRPLVLYKTSTISSIAPLSGLRGTTVTVRITHAASLFSGSNTLPTSAVFNCLSSGTTFSGSVQSNTIMSCNVTSSLYQLFLSTLFTLPSYSSNQITLAPNNTNSVFNYLDSGLISFPTNQTRFFLTSTSHTYNVTISTSIPSNVQSFGTCKISGEVGFSTGSFVSSTGSDNSYICTQSITTPGQKTLTFSIVQSTDIYQLSSNSLPVVYATLCNVISYTPQAAIANLTTNFVFKTTFASVSYGSSTFECRYGLDLDRLAFSSPATFSNGDFSCGILYPDKDSKVYVSLWMTAFGTTRRISNLDTLVNVVTANYFTPSLGTPTGGESVRILVYGGINTNVTFNSTNNFIFRCNNTQTTLDCITPTISTFNIIPLYTSQFLRFTNNSFIDPILSARYIFYERRSIVTYSPSIIPAYISSFNMTFTVDKNTTIPQGQFISVVASSTTNDRRSVATQTNNVTFRTTINPISSGGLYPMEIYYSHPDSFEVQSMFSISSGVNVTFLESQNIALAPTSDSNIIYINRNSVVSIQLDGSQFSLAPSAYQFIKCKLGNQVVTTSFIGTGFNCSITSSVPKNESLTLWYINTDAFQGEFMISSNSIDIIFVSPITVQTISPFASLNTPQNIDVTTTVFSNVYGSVSFQCEFNGTFSQASLNGNRFNCDLSKLYPAYGGVVSIYITSLQTSRSLLFTSISASSPMFYFLNQIPTISISPHARQDQISNLNVPVTINLSSDLLIARNLTCELESNEGKIYTNASYGADSRTILCNVFKSTFSNPFESINVRLYMDVSPTVKFYITSNFEQFAFIKKPINWSSSRFITTTSFFTMNMTLPVSSFIYQLNTTSFGIPCIFTGTPNCSLTQAIFDSLNRVPFKLTMTFYIAHPVSGISIPLQIDDVVIYYNTEIQHLKPFVITYQQRTFSPARIILNTFKKLDNTLNYRCNIAQPSSGQSRVAPGVFDVASTEFQTNLDTESHISCSFTTFGTSNSFYNVSLEVQNPYSSTWNSLTSSSTLISVINEITYSPSQGPSSGGTYLSINFNYFPQTAYQNYNLSMKVFDRNTYIDFTRCSVSISSKTLECFTPNITSYYRVWTEPTRKLRVDFMIDGVRAITLNPFFTFYLTLDIQSVLPSRFIYGLAPSNIRFVTSNQLAYLGSITFGFSGQRYVTCSIESTTTILCPNLLLNQNLDYNVDYTFNGFDYVSSGQTLTAFLAIPVSSFTPTSLSMYQNTLLTIKTTASFLNSPNIIVRVSDNLLKIDVPGTFVDAQTITATIPPFYDKNALFPRSLKVSVSYDSGTFFADAPTTITVAAFPSVSITNFIPLNQRLTGLKLSGFPSTGLDFNSSNTLLFRLVDRSDSSNIIPLTCIAPYSQCDMVTSITRAGTYDLKIGLSQSGVFTPIFVTTNSAQTYTFLSTEVTSVSPRIIVRNSKNPIRLLGDFSRFSSASCSVLFTSFTGILASSVASTATVTSSGLQATVPSIPTSPLLSLSVSFNDGVFYHPLGQNSTFINDYTFTISNPDNVRDPNVFFTFLNSNITMIGTNLINTGSVKVTLSNTNFNVDITSFSTTQLQFLSTTLVKLNAPLLSQLNINYTTQFPLTLDLGLSLNGGVDTKYAKFIYNDQYPQPLYSSIFPSLTFRRDLNLTVYGLNLDLASKCSVYDVSNTTVGAEIYETTPQATSQSNNVICYIPQLPFERKKVAVFLKNLQNIRGTTYYNLTFYDIPIITSSTPAIGISYGKFPVMVSGINFTLSEDVPKIYCRFNSFTCDEPCTYISPSQIQCKAPSHPPGPSFLQISYNNLDWHMSTQNTTFTPCEAGYSTSDFSRPCTLCPPGTFKPTSGIYNCISCTNDTYSQFAGSLSCEKCADNTTTGSTIGAKSPRDCVCKVGYYMNTNLEEVVGLYRKCIQCPEGGSCPTINTTIPLAKPGYWYDQSDWTSFASCLPAASCPGGGFQNCSTGYMGLRCGVCEKGFYRFKKNCDKCDDLASSWLRLIGIGVGIAIVTAIFFALSATKVSHIASIAIAFSFWQVLSMFARFDIQWPGTISGTLTGASIANFNFDFLNPACIFRDMNYITLWYLQMMLPVAFLVSFIILYIILILRSLMATGIGKFIKISYINPKYLLKEEESDDEGEKKPKEKDSFIGRILASIANFLLRSLLFIRNFTVWTFTEKSSYRELKKILNRIINAYFAFLSFSFIFIMTTASTVFVCKHQTNGSWTLNESPDIKCFEDGAWWAMMPFTILWYIIFGGGSLVYFVVIWFKYDEWSKDTDFNERNKFMLARFRNKYYFWEAVVTLRKTILSILYIFFKPMLVIVSGVLLLFIGFLIHIYFVPFKRKFHNVMDYFVILVTMATLFFGLLFFVNKWPDKDPITGYSQLKVVSEWIAFFVLIGSTIVVVAMILWDSNTRRKKEKKRLRKKLRKLILEQEEDRKTKQILLDLHDQKAENTFIHSYDMPWDVEFDYKPVNFKTDSESTSSEELTMNEIFFDLFSKKRLKKKFNILKKKGNKVTGIVIKKIKGEKEKEAEKPLIREDTLAGIKMDKKTQSEYDYVLKKMEEENRKSLAVVVDTNKNKSMKGVKNLKSKDDISLLQQEIEAEDIQQKENPEKVSQLLRLKKKDTREDRENKQPDQEPKEVKEEVKIEEVKVEEPKIEEKKEKPKPIEKKYPLITNRNELYPGPLEEFTYKEESDENVIWEDVLVNNQKSIKEVSLDKLIELLTSPTYFDAHMQHTFMLTFRSFTDSDTLFKKLIERFNIQPQQELSDEEFSKWKVEVLDKIRLRVSSTIKYWIENFYIFDFTDQKMKDYVDDTIKMMDKCKGGKIFSNVIVRALSKAMDEDQKLIITQVECPPIEKPVVEKRKSLFTGGTVSKSLKHPILVWPSIEIARQLTLIEFANFTKIEPKECLNQSWAKGQRETKAPGICAMVARFNLVSMWVGTTIVQVSDIDERVLTVEKFIDIADKLYELNNFNGVFTIVSGLALAPVYRLKKTFPLLSEEAKSKYENLTKLISRDGNFKAIREKIKNVKPPAMPYIGIYLTDLTFIEDGNPKYVNGKINFVKCKCFAGVIRDMQTYQNTKYNFYKASDIYEPLLNLVTMQEKEMYNLSLEIEPKEKKQPKQ